MGAINPNPYWAQATWFIDPGNSSGLASDGNSGLDATHPLLTFAELANRWGTYSPRIRQNTTITFMSSQPDNTDPVMLTPYLEGATFVVQGVLGAAQQIATGVLASTVAKNRATPQLLQTNSGATATNQLVVNTTHPSRAWTSQLAAAGIFNMSQPLAPATVPSLLTTATSVDTWANGDAVTVYAPVTIHVVEITPRISLVGGFANIGLFVYQLNVAPLFTGGFMIFSPEVSFVESNLATIIALCIGATRPGLQVAQVNACFGEIDGGPGAGVLPLIGGRLDFGRMGCVQLSNDILVGIGAGSNGIDLGGMQVSALGAVFISSGCRLNLSESCRGDLTLGGSTLVLWGIGGVNLRGRARLQYPSGAGGAVAAFLQTGVFLMNDQSTAYSLTGAVWAGGIAISAANLDAASGAAGFGGQAINPNGATISNTGS